MARPALPPKHPVAKRWGLTSESFAEMLGLQRRSLERTPSVTAEAHLTTLAKVQELQLHTAELFRMLAILEAELPRSIWKEMKWLEDLWNQHFAALKPEPFQPKEKS